MILLVVIGTLIFDAGGAAARQVSQADRADTLQRIELRRSVTNVEYEIGYLMREKPSSLGSMPPTEGEAWYGFIPRRLPGEAMNDHKHFIPFVVEYLAGKPNRAW